MQHIHMIWSVPKNRYETFEALFSAGAQTTPWTSIIAAGSHRMDRIYDANGWINYCMKQSAFENLIISGALIPEKS
jgi:hypothetical protein